MKTFTYAALIGAASLLTCSSSYATISGAGTLKITAPGLSGGDADGPYNVVSTATTGPSLGSFQTFCLGSKVDFVSGQSYDYSISLQVQPFASEGLHPNPTTALSYVALGTAWLYNQFLTGSIGTLGVNNSQNDAIQLAIWYLQGQSGGADNSYVAKAITALGAGNIENNANGT